MNESPRFTLRPHRDPQCAQEVLTARGELDLGASGQARTQLLEALTDGAVILDMREVTFCDSSGLRILVEAHRYAQARANPFCIAAPSDAVTRVLALTEADKVIPVFPDTSSALAR